MAVPARNQRRLVLLFAALSLACAPAPREGETVHIAEESALIVAAGAARQLTLFNDTSAPRTGKDFRHVAGHPAQVTRA